MPITTPGDVVVCSWRGTALAVTSSPHVPIEPGRPGWITVTPEQPLTIAVAVAERLQPRQTFFTHVCHDLSHAGTNRSLPAGMALAHDGLQLTVEVG